ncbi:MAG: hypothetical protein OGMRLDGQ_001145, partial [Candidatus Fervidibacter sp.]
RQSLLKQAEKLEGTSPDVPKIFGSAGALPSRKTIRYSPFATRCRFRLGSSLALPIFLSHVPCPLSRHKGTFNGNGSH